MRFISTWYISYNVFNRLFEAEQRYRNREPRLEDLEQISELKFIVREQEQKIKEIIVRI